MGLVRVPRVRACLMQVVHSVTPYVVEKTHGQECAADLGKPRPVQGGGIKRLKFSLR